MAIKLTNETVRSLPAGKSGDAIYPDANHRDAVPGLYLRVREGGSRTYVIQWRHGQRQRRSTIGKAGVLTLDQARQKARKALVGIDEGNDPVAERAKNRVTDKLLFETVVQEYLDARTDFKARSLEETKRYLESVWKPLNKLVVSKIERATVAAELRTIIKERGPVAADRARSALSAFFSWCVGEGYADTNPVIGTNRASNGQARERILKDGELVKIWNACREDDFGWIVRLLMLTVQRREEISGLHRSEVDEDDMGRKLIALPGERTKNSRPHDVPLSAQAWAVLDEIAEDDERDLIFGSGEGGFSGYSKAKATLDERSGVTDWTLHDLRRTGATRMADLGVQPHIIEAVLNHISGHKAGVAGIYNRATYAAEKRAALDLWGSHVQTLLAKAEGANVTRLKRRT